MEFTKLLEKLIDSPTSATMHDIGHYIEDGHIGAQRYREYSESLRGDASPKYRNMAACGLESEVAGNIMSEAVKEGRDGPGAKEIVKLVERAKQKQKPHIAVELLKPSNLGARFPDVREAVSFAVVRDAVADYIYSMACKEYEMGSCHETCPFGVKQNGAINCAGIIHDSIEVLKAYSRSDGASKALAVLNQILT